MPIYIYGAVKVYPQAKFSETNGPTHLKEQQKHLQLDKASKKFESIYYKRLIYAVSLMS